LLATANLSRAWRPSLQGPALLVGILFGASLLCLGLAVTNWFTTPDAVVTAATQARYGPLEESKPHYPLAEGTEIRVLDRRPDWVQVRDRQGRIGWVPGNDLALVQWPDLERQRQSQPQHASRQDPE
jgi:hypothetical protein